MLHVVLCVCVSASSPPLHFIQPHQLDSALDATDDADMEVIDMAPPTTQKATFVPMKPAGGLFKKGLVDRNFAVESSNAEVRGGTCKRVQRAWHGTE